MPSALNTKIRNLETEMQLFANDFNLLQQHCSTLSTYLNLEGNPLSATSASGMQIDLYRMWQHWGTGQSSIKYNLIWALDYINNFATFGGPGSLDMGTILSAMLEASFEELTSFMGITQAYKVAVWDSPFNEEYYAALARGFKVWGA